MSERRVQFCKKIKKEMTEKNKKYLNKCLV